MYKLQILAWFIVALLLLIVCLQSIKLKRLQALGHTAIEAEQQRLLKILESTSDLVSTARPDATVTYINAAGKRMLGWKQDESISDKRIADAHPPHSLQQIAKKAIPTAIDLGIWRGETTILTPQGREIPVSQILMSHKSVDGKVEYLSTVMRDITELKEVEKELKKAKEAAEAANQAKSEFLANMSHEIRTPMNAVLGFTEILSELISDKMQQEYLHSIQSSARSLLSLINDILDLSKVEAGKLQLQYSAVKIREVFQEMHQIFHQKIAQKKLDFQLEIDSELPQALVLDEVRLRQVLLNLLGNAIKFTDFGHVKLAAYGKKIGSKQGVFNLNFAISDTGVGIPKEQQQLIFGAFEQQQGQSHAQFGGTGLGLAITKRLVEIMDGSIELTSEVEKGSTFEVSLKNIKIASISEVKNVKKSFDVSTITFSPATILIGDDVATNRKLVKTYLQQFDFNFIEAKTGEEVVALSKNEEPDLILMDMKMPILNGYQASQKIKKEQKLQSIPIVALTASAMKHQKWLQELCDGFLSKPIGKTDLVLELTKYLKHSITKVDKKRPSNLQEKSQPAEEQPFYSDEVLKKLPQLLQILETQVNVCEKLCITLSINEIENFGVNLQQLGNEYNYSPLVTLGKELECQASTFDLELLPQTLKSFPQAIKEIQALLKI